MEGIKFAKEVLINPYFSEEGDGRRLKYVIDMRDNFLQGSTIVKDSKD